MNKDFGTVGDVAQADARCVAAGLAARYNSELGAYRTRAAEVTERPDGTLLLHGEPASGREVEDFVASRYGYKINLENRRLRDLGAQGWSLMWLPSSRAGNVLVAVRPGFDTNGIVRTVPPARREAIQAAHEAGNLVIFSDGAQNAPQCLYCWLGIPDIHAAGKAARMARLGY